VRSRAAKRISAAVIGAAAASFTYGAGLNPARAAAARSSGFDWIVARVRAGPRGASGIGLELSAAGLRVGAGPYVNGVLVGGAGTRSAGFATQRGQDQIALRASVGAVTVEQVLVQLAGPGPVGEHDQLSFPVHLAAGQEVDALVFATGVDYESFAGRAASQSGSVSLTLLTGRGSALETVFNPAPAQPSADALGVATADEDFPVHMPVGVAGAFVECSVCEGSWTAPDGRAAAYTEVNEPSSSFFVTPGRSFAGPAGKWALQWIGATVDPLTHNALVAWAPIGRLWRLFA